MDLTADFQEPAKRLKRRVAMRSLCASWFHLCCMVRMLCVLKRQGKVCGLCYGYADHDSVGCQRAVTGTSLSRLNTYPRRGQIVTQSLCLAAEGQSFTGFERLLSAIPKFCVETASIKKASRRTCSRSLTGSIRARTTCLHASAVVTTGSQALTRVNGLSCCLAGWAC